MVVWAIASEDTEAAARDFAEDLELTMPVLYDEGGEVHTLYRLDPTVPAAAYPEEWIVGTDGTIVYRAAEYHHDAVVEVIEAELAGG